MDDGVIARLTVTCSGRDNAGLPTHDRQVLFDFGLDEQLGVVLMPTAQQRRDPQATRPRFLGTDIRCWMCGDEARVGKPPHKGLRKVILRATDAGQSEISVQLLRAALTTR